MKGNRPLHKACQTGHFDIAQWLVNEHSANIECTDVEGNRPLHKACQAGHFEIAQWLVNEHSANVECMDMEGNQSMPRVNGSLTQSMLRVAMVLCCLFSGLWMQMESVLTCQTRMAGRHYGMLASVAQIWTSSSGW